ncbi:MAG: polyamine ABC transporter substrate-binding protein [Steroidobacteraceae bacterium]
MNIRLRALAVGALALLVAGCGGKKDETPAGEGTASPAAEEQVLNVYNWSDYIDKSTIPEFQKRTGIKVVYDVFDSNEVLETKLLTGKTGYDVVVPSASFLERQIKAGVFMKLDRSKLTNFRDLDADLMKRVALHDPGNQYAVPYLWGTTGIGYNVDKVKKALGDVPVDSWALLFDPKNAAKLEGCGLVLLDAPSEVVDSALIYLGKDPNSENADDLKAVEELLMKIRPYVRYLHSSQYINDLANGEICAALGWSGDVFQAKSRAEEAGKGVHVGYSIPKEGAIMWFDMLAIPADAKHPDNAHKFINYLLEPAVIAKVSNYVAYANPNALATAMVDEAVRKNPAIYPNDEVRQKLFPHLAESSEFSRLLNRSWTRFRTGQ